jgi:hypothetical protein
VPVPFTLHWVGAAAGTSADVPYRVTVLDGPGFTNVVSQQAFTATFAPGQETVARTFALPDAAVERRVLVEVLPPAGQPVSFSIDLMLSALVIAADPNPSTSFEYDKDLFKDVKTITAKVVKAAEEKNGMKQIPISVRGGHVKSVLDTNKEYKFKSEVTLVDGTIKKDVEFTLKGTFTASATDPYAVTYTATCDLPGHVVRFEAGTHKKTFYPDDLVDPTNPAFDTYYKGLLRHAFKTADANGKTDSSKGTFEDVGQVDQIVGGATLTVKAKIKGSYSYDKTKNVVTITHAFPVK